MTQSEQERIPARLIGAIIAVGSLAFIGILTETVMTVLFPQLMEELHVGTAAVQWITTVYLLAVGVTMPISSYLKRRFTLKTIFIMATVLAVIGSVLMIVAPNFPLLIVARAIQGVGSGIASPLMINIILEQSPRSKVGRLMGVGSLVITVAPAIGPTVGGAITSVLPWRAIFIIVIPIMLLSLLLGLRCIEQKTPTQSAQLNPLQFIAIIVGLSGLIMALNQAGIAVSHAVAGASILPSAPVALISAALGIAALVFFGWSSRRAFSPLIRLGILRDNVVLLHLLAFSIMPMIGIGFGYLITNVAQLAMHTNSFIAGALVLPGALIGALCAPIGGSLLDRFGPARPVITAFSVAIVGPVLLLMFAMHMTPVMLAGFYFIFAVGYAFGFSNIMTSALMDIDREFVPDGNAIFNTMLQFGGAAGTTLFSTLLAVAQAGSNVDDPAFATATLHGAQWSYAVMCVICVIAITAMLFAFRIRAQRQQHIH